MDRRNIKWMAIGAGAAVGLGALGMVAFLYSGVYPIAANEPHTALVQRILTLLQERSVAVRAGDRPMPDLRDPDLLSLGAALYDEQCLLCHGAPAIEREIIGRGLNPNPPRLATEAHEWTNRELYWIVANGLKMAGMPAFRPGLTEGEVWATVAFMRALPTLTPEEYRLAVARAEEGGWPRAVTGDTVTLAARRTGDADEGRALVAGYGCGSCHLIPGVAGARGRVGPPLDDFGLRHYIAGALLNTPENLAVWLIDPQAVEPGTAMPAMGVRPDEALHMAAYLHSLGADERLGPPQLLPARWLPRH